MSKESDVADSEAEGSGQNKDSNVAEPEGEEKAAGQDKDSNVVGPEGEEKAAGQDKDSEPEGEEKAAGQDKDSNVEPEGEKAAGQDKDSNVEPEGEKAAGKCPISKKRSKWMKFLLCVTQTEKSNHTCFFHCSQEIKKLSSFGNL